MTSLNSTNSTTTMNSITGKPNNAPMAKEVNLPNLQKKRKTVSFSDKINIINVECWKKYNTDMSEQSEMNILRKKIEEYKLKEGERVICSCGIF